MSDLETPIERLNRLEAENRDLRARLGRLESAPAIAARPTSRGLVPVPAAGPATPISRRTVLGRAGAGAVALGAAAAAGVTLVNPATSLAVTLPVNLGVDNPASALTSITNNTDDETVFAGVSGGSGTGVNGSSIGGIGTSGASETGTGVDGYAFSGLGVDGYSVSGTGVRGSTDNGTAIQGLGNHGRGGRFSARRLPSSSQPDKGSRHPASGGKGDLFVDKSGRLWYCKGGSSWKQLA